ncbi:hypothetical protein [Acidithiobacillus ferrianus]|uniref:hypothetical protein n=1 Tax=Acidithiobacillus ferrianus TaxID=2678518 RepID=UPI0034E4FDAF
MYPGKYTASIMLALGLTAPITSWAGGVLLHLRDQAEHSSTALQQLKQQAHTGDRAAQYYLGALYDPSLKLGHVEPANWNRRFIGISMSPCRKMIRSPAIPIRPWPIHPPR